MIVSAPVFDPMETMHDTNTEPEMADCKTFVSVIQMVNTQIFCAAVSHVRFNKFSFNDYIQILAKTKSYWGREIGEIGKNRRDSESEAKIYAAAFVILLMFLNMNKWISIEKLLFYWVVSLNSGTNYSSTSRVNECVTDNVGSIH